MQSWEVETVTEGTVMEEAETVTGAGEIELAVRVSSRKICLGWKKDFKILLKFMSVTDHTTLMAGCRSVHIIIIT